MGMLAADAGLSLHYGRVIPGSYAHAPAGDWFSGIGLPPFIQEGDDRVDITAVLPMMLSQVNQNPTVISPSEVLIVAAAWPYGAKQWRMRWSYVDRPGETLYEYAPPMAGADQWYFNAWAWTIIGKWPPGSPAPVGPYGELWRSGDVLCDLTVGPTGPDQGGVMKRAQVLFHVLNDQARAPGLAFSIDGASFREHPDGHYAPLEPATVLVAASQNTNALLYATAQVRNDADGSTVGQSAVSGDSVVAVPIIMPGRPGNYILNVELWASLDGSTFTRVAVQEALAFAAVDAPAVLGARNLRLVGFS